MWTSDTPFTCIHLQKVVTINKLGLRFWEQVGFGGTSVLCCIAVYFFFSSLAEVPASQSYFADVILGMKKLQCDMDKLECVRAEFCSKLEK